MRSIEFLHENNNIHLQPTINSGKVVISLHDSLVCMAGANRSFMRAETCLTHREQYSTTLPSYVGFTLFTMKYWSRQATKADQSTSSLKFCWQHSWSTGALVQECLIATWDETSSRAGAVLICENTCRNKQIRVELQTFGGLRKLLQNARETRHPYVWASDTDDRPTCHWYIKG